MPLKYYWLWTTNRTGWLGFGNPRNYFPFMPKWIMNWAYRLTIIGLVVSIFWGKI